MNENKNKDALNFYMDLFKEEEEQKATENLKQIDFKNKNLSNEEQNEDLNDFDFKKIY